MAEPTEEVPDEDGPTADPLPEDDEDPPVRPANWSDVVACADHSFVVTDTWLLAVDKLHLALRGLGLDAADPALAPLRAAMNFQLREHRGPKAEVTLTYFGLPGEPVLTPKTVTRETREGWRRLSTAVTHPAARARMYDLLWQGGGPAVLADCTAALDAYLEIATIEPYAVRVAAADGPGKEVGTVEWQARDRDLALGRALSISHVAARDEPGSRSATRARKIALARLEQHLADDLPNAGNSLLLLAMLVRHRRSLTEAQRGALQGLVDVALTKYASQDYLVDEIAEMLMRLLPSQRHRAQRVRVEARLAIADQRPQPAVKMHFLEQAAALARDFRIDDLGDQATRRMQAIKPEDLGFQIFTSQVDVPPEIVRADVLRMSQGATWREALHSWLLTPAPTGSAEENQHTAELVNGRSVARMLGMPTVVCGPDGLPRWTTQSEADQRAWELVGVERVRLTSSGQLLAEALDRIVTDHTAPGEDKLTAFLAEQGTGDAALASAMARVLLRYWRGDYEGSLHTAVPRIEAGARRLVLALDEPAYQVARGAQQGMYVGLPALLDVLAQHDFDPDWDRFLRTFLLGPAGLNGRHDLAHGFNLHRRPRVEAALALRGLGLFVAMPFPADPAQGPTPPPQRPLLASSVTGAVTNLVRLSVQQRVPIRALLRHERRAALTVARAGVAALTRLLR